MKKLNSKGFSAVEALVIVVIIGLVGAVGWLVYDRQKDKQDSTTPTTSKSMTTPEEADEDKKPELPGGYAKYKIGDTGVTLAYPSSWGEAKAISKSKGGGYDVNGMTLKVENDAGLKISRSFNAPSYCAYNSTDKSWDKSGEYPPNSCEPSTLTVFGIKAYGFSKGALGAYGFTYAINLKGDKFLLISDALLSDGTAEKDPETYPSDEDAEELKSELSDKVEIILTNNSTLFE